MANTVETIFTANNQTDKAFNQLLRDVKRTADGVETMGKKGTASLDKLERKAKSTSKGFGRSVSVMAGKFLILELAISKVAKMLDTLVFDFNAKLETAQLGIASAFLTGGEYVDKTTGKVLEGQDALKAAQADATVITKKLQAANLQTIATLDQLVRAYQETLPVAMSKGFDRSQVEDFTVAMVQAAGSIGLSLDQLGEETRSILTGAINPRTSRIATVLGLTNADIAQFKGNADELFSFLMDKLSAYREAGIESQKTWAGVWSNAVDIFKQISAEVSKPLFEQIKKDLGGISDEFITINEATGELEIDAKFEGLTDLLSSIYAALKGTLSVLKAHYELLEDVGIVDAAAYSFARLAESAVAYANAIRMASEYSQGNVGFLDWMTASPEDTQKILDDLGKQDRALMSLQVRVKDLKSTKLGNLWWSTHQEDELQRAIKAVSNYKAQVQDVIALKNADQHIAAKPFDLLEYRQREKPEDPKDATKLQNALSGLSLDVEKLGLNKFDAKIADINAKAAELREKFGDLSEIEVWRKAQVGAVATSKDLALLKGELKDLEGTTDNALGAFQTFAEGLNLTDDAMTEITAGLTLYDETIEDLGTKSGAVFEEMSNAVQGWASGFSDELNDAFWSADFSFSRILESFGRMLTQMVIQKQIVEPLLSSGLNFIGGLFPGTAAAAGAPLTIAGSGLGFGDYSNFSLGANPSFHEGGMFVPKFHSGGLNADEGLAILKGGERVLTGEQNHTFDKLAALLTGGGAGSAGGIVIKQSIQVDARGSSVSEADIERAVERGAEQGYQQVYEDVAGRGPIARRIG